MAGLTEVRMETSAVTVGRIKTSCHSSSHQKADEPFKTTGHSLRTHRPFCLYKHWKLLIIKKKSQLEVNPHFTVWIFYCRFKCFITTRRPILLFQANLLVSPKGYMCDDMPRCAWNNAGWHAVLGSCMLTSLIVTSLPQWKGDCPVGH